MADDAKPLQPWERQNDEPEAAYEAFKGFVYQTPPRRLAHSSVAHGYNALSKLYNEWRWADRATAYDRYTQAIRDAERDALVRQDARERTAGQISLLKAVSEVASRELTKLLRDSKKTESFGLVKVSDLNKLIGQVIMMERLIHGESTENVQNVDDDGLKSLSVEDLKELQRIRAKLEQASEDDEERH